MLLATEADYLVWSEDEPPDALGRYLRRASQIVQRATRLAVYSVDVTGAPVLTAVTTALRDATCAQVQEWVLAKVDPATITLGAGARVVQQTSANGAAVTYAPDPASSVTALGQRQAAAQGLCAEAYDILANAGLIGGPLVVLG